MLLACFVYNLSCFHINVATTLLGILHMKALMRRLVALIKRIQRGAPEKKDG